MSLDKNSGLLPKSPLGAFFEKKGKKHFLAKSNNKGKKAVIYIILCTFSAF